MTSTTPIVYNKKITKLIASNSESLNLNTKYIQFMKQMLVHSC